MHTMLFLIRLVVAALHRKVPLISDRLTYSRAEIAENLLLIAHAELDVGLLQKASLWV